jgi:hypothetical protein
MLIVAEGSAATILVEAATPISTLVLARKTQPRRTHLRVLVEVSGRMKARTLGGTLEGPRE